MKTTYSFVNETVSVDIPEPWAALLDELDKQWYNSDRKETRRHISLNSMMFEGDIFAGDDDVLASLEKAETSQELQAAIAALKPEQQRLIQAVYFDEVPVSTYANLEDVSQSAISHRLKTIYAKIKKLL